MWPSSFRPSASEEVEKQRTEYLGKCFECYSADIANQSTKKAEDDIKYQQELARVLEESKDFVPAWESLDKIFEPSLKDHSKITKKS